MAREKFGNGGCRFGFNDVVSVKKAPSEAAGHEWADGGFPRAHEAGEYDAPGRSGLGGQSHGQVRQVSARTLCSV
jgi:hypothetical protein